MEVLKNNKLTKYYNNIQQIYCGVTWVAPPSLIREEETMKIQMFKEVERSYRKYINRYNFFSYSYVLKIKDFEKGRTCKIFLIIKM